MSSKKLRRWTDKTFGTGDVSRLVGDIWSVPTDIANSIGQPIYQGARDAIGITAAEQAADASRQMLLNDQKARQMQRDTDVQQQRSRELELSNSAEARRRRRGGSTSIGGADAAPDLSSDLLGV